MTCGEWPCIDSLTPVTAPRPDALNSYALNSSTM